MILGIQMIFHDFGLIGIYCIWSISNPKIIEKKSPESKFRKSRFRIVLKSFQSRNSGSPPSLGRFRLPRLGGPRDPAWGLGGSAGGLLDPCRLRGPRNIGTVPPSGSPFREPFSGDFLTTFIFKYFREPFSGDF